MTFSYWMKTLFGELYLARSSFPSPSVGVFAGFFRQVFTKIRSLQSYRQNTCHCFHWNTRACLVDLLCARLELQRISWSCRPKHPQLAQTTLEMIDGRISPNLKVPRSRCDIWVQGYVHSSLCLVAPRDSKNRRGHCLQARTVHLVYGSPRLSGQLMDRIYKHGRRKHGEKYGYVLPRKDQVVGIDARGHLQNVE